MSPFREDNTQHSYDSEPNPNQEDFVLGVLDSYYDDQELRDLCFDLERDYDNLSGRTKREKCQSLIQLFLNDGSGLDSLETFLRSERPGAFGDDGSVEVALPDVDNLSLVSGDDQEGDKKLPLETEAKEWIQIPDDEKQEISSFMTQPGAGIKLGDVRKVYISIRGGDYLFISKKKFVRDSLGGEEYDPVLMYKVIFHHRPDLRQGFPNGELLDALESDTTYLDIFDPKDNELVAALSSLPAFQLQLIAFYMREDWKTFRRVSESKTSAFVKEMILSGKKKSLINAIFYFANAYGLPFEKKFVCQGEEFNQIVGKYPSEVAAISKFFEEDYRKFCKQHHVNSSLLRGLSTEEKGVVFLFLLVKLKKTQHLDGFRLSSGGTLKIWSRDNDAIEQKAFQTQSPPSEKQAVGDVTLEVPEFLRHNPDTWFKKSLAFIGMDEIELLVSTIPNFPFYDMRRDTVSETVMEIFYFCQRRPDYYPELKKAVLRSDFAYIVKKIFPTEMYDIEQEDLKPILGNMFELKSLEDAYLIALKQILVNELKGLDKITRATREYDINAIVNTGQKYPSVIVCHIVDYANMRSKIGKLLKSIHNSGLDVNLSLFGYPGR